MAYRIAERPFPKRAHTYWIKSNGVFWCGHVHRIKDRALMCTEVLYGRTAEVCNRAARFLPQRYMTLCLECEKPTCHEALVTHWEKWVCSACDHYRCI